MYQGSHGNGLAFFADLILPTSTYVERTSFYKNLLGGVQKTSLAVSFDSSIRTDVVVFKYMLDGVFSKFLKKFYNFTYINGIKYNKQRA